MSQKPYVIDQMISAKAIAARVEELAREITAHFHDTDKLVVVGLLRGSFVFIADLVREIDLPVEVDFLEASSYGNAMESSREVRILKDLRGEIAGRDVLVVEDIVDTGFTLHHVKNLLLSREPRRLEICALLDKPSRREVNSERPPWTGFEIPRRIRRRLWHRLCTAQPQPALHRQGALPRDLTHGADLVPAHGPLGPQAAFAAPGGAGLRGDCPVPRRRRVRMAVRLARGTDPQSGRRTAPAAIGWPRVRTLDRPCGSGHSSRGVIQAAPRRLRRTAA